MKAPPFINSVAASGTNKTLKPIYYSTTERVANAVVFPAHGPPVRHILVIGCLLSFNALTDALDGLVNDGLVDAYSLTRALAKSELRQTQAEMRE